MTTSKPDAPPPIARLWNRRQPGVYLIPEGLTPYRTFYIFCNIKEPSHDSQEGCLKGRLENTDYERVAHALILYMLHKNKGWIGVGVGSFCVYVSQNLKLEKTFFDRLDDLLVGMEADGWIFSLLNEHGLKVVYFTQKLAEEIQEG